jgi:small subunit ribosomal protein S2
MAVVSMRQLLGAGVHFGHQTRRWNPKMRRFILGERNGIYLIDLHKTLDGIESAYGFVRELVAGGGTILFVGTKKQTQGPVSDYAEACGMPYVNQRWLGGMLTNFQTVSSRVKRMQELRVMQAAGDFDAMPKKEALRHVRELEKLSRNLGGISGLNKLPDAIFVIDTKKEHIAVTEANKLGLPVVAVVDTNCDPDVITYVIPGNDDAIRSGTLMCRVIADAVAEGRFIASHRPAKPSANGAEGGAGAPAGRAPSAPRNRPAPPRSRPASGDAAGAAPAAEPASEAPSAAPAAPAEAPQAPQAAAPDAATDTAAPATPDSAGGDAPAAATSEA